MATLGNNDRPPAKSFDLNELKIRGKVKRMGPTMFLLIGNVVGPRDTCKNVGWFARHEFNLRFVEKLNII